MRPEGEVMYYCTNAACPAQAQERLEHFASRGAVDIRGIGESMSALLLREGLVKDVSGIYYLTRERLASLERMGEKSASNLIKSINDSKKRPLARVIYALGIRHIGGETAELLARQFNSVDELANASQEDLLSIPTIGPKIAESIVTFFRQEANRGIIERLKAAGVQMEKEAVKAEQLPLADHEFVITGRLTSFTREEAEARIKALGGVTKENITRKTTYLVVGEEPGSKLVRAQELGIKQLTEDELLKLLEQKG
jgi:DNA ligase (NAD+)